MCVDVHRTELKWMKKKYHNTDNRWILWWLLLLLFGTSKVNLNVILTAMTAIPKAKSTKTINQKRSVHPLTCNGTFLFSESLLKHPPILSYNSLLIVYKIFLFFMCVLKCLMFCFFFFVYDDTRWWHKFQYPNWTNRRLFCSNSF